MISTCSRLDRCLTIFTFKLPVARLLSRNSDIFNVMVTSAHYPDFMAGAVRQAMLVTYLMTTLIFVGFIIRHTYWWLLVISKSCWEADMHYFCCRQKWMNTCRMASLKIRTPVMCRPKKIMITTCRIWIFLIATVGWMAIVMKKS